MWYSDKKIVRAAKAKLIICRQQIVKNSIISLSLQVIRPQYVALHLCIAARHSSCSRSIANLTHSHCRNHKSDRLEVPSTRTRFENKIWIVSTLFLGISIKVHAQTRLQSTFESHRKPRRTSRFTPPRSLFNNNGDNIVFQHQVHSVMNRLSHESLSCLTRFVVIKTTTHSREEKRETMMPSTERGYVVKISLFFDCHLLILLPPTTTTPARQTLLQYTN
jgi:hypothetical protein